jgi:hypothetical protein
MSTIARGVLQVANRLQKRQKSGSNRAVLRPLLNPDPGGLQKSAGRVRILPSRAEWRALQKALPALRVTFGVNTAEVEFMISSETDSSASKIPMPMATPHHRFVLVATFRVHSSKGSDSGPRSRPECPCHFYVSKL